jgi:hypothetical protein
MSESSVRAPDQHDASRIRDPAEKEFRINTQQHGKRKPRHE